MTTRLLNICVSKNKYLVIVKSIFLHQLTNIFFHTNVKNRNVSLLY